MWVSVCIASTARSPEIPHYETNVFSAFRCHRIYALDLLETKVLSYEPPLPRRIYGPWSILYIRHRIILSVSHRAPSSSTHNGHLHRPYAVRMPDEIRFYLMDAISIRWSVGLNPIWIHGYVLPREHLGRACILGSRGLDIFGIHLGWHSINHETHACRGGNRCCDQPLPWHH